MHALQWGVGRATEAALDDGSPGAELDWGRAWRLEAQPEERESRLPYDVLVSEEAWRLTYTRLKDTCAASPPNPQRHAHTHTRHTHARARTHSARAVPGPRLCD